MRDWNMRSFKPSRSAGLKTGFLHRSVRSSMKFQVMRSVRNRAPIFFSRAPIMSFLKRSVARNCCM